MNRRSFIQQALTLTGALALFPVLAKSEERRRGGGAATPAAGGVALVSPKDPQAVALNYVEKHSDLKNKTLQTEKSGVKWADQKCLSCSFYGKETTISGKKAGPCQLFPGKAVLAEGWCASWAKKA